MSEYLAEVFGPRVTAGKVLGALRCLFVHTARPVGMRERAATRGGCRRPAPGRTTAGDAKLEGATNGGAFEGEPRLRRIRWGPSFAHPRVASDIPDA